MRLKTLGFVLSLSTMMLCPAQAAENGNTQYSPGSSQFFAGAFPPFPGLYFLSQSSYYASNRLNDGNGKEIPIDFKVRAASETMRFLYVTPLEFAGARLSTQLVVPIVNVDLSTAFFSASDLGLADMVGTIGLTWHPDRKSSYTLGLDIAAPVGKYDVANAASPGLNHWSFQPALGYHYSDPQGLEIGALARLIFNTENPDTNYTSGNEFVLDYAAGWNFDKWRIGAVGYYLQQLTDDSGPGAPADGHRGKGLAIGPSLTYSFTPALQLSSSWQHDVIAENRAQGDTFWFNIAAKF
ncbi:SphA family protein [Roseibium litorale]|uniref:Transporter n=1 Tax=Roseibium litorale TaxID=2803841 RepID=A0ABR9CRI9_9HYPH|nr:transporter [Roseibium litorale]MBD8893293.1 transporter [Roseibium litorale]